MLQNLINLVKENAGESIINNPSVPNEKNDKAIEVTGNSIIETLKNAVAGGDISQLTSLFNQEPEAAKTSTLANNAQNNVVANLIAKIGLSPEIATKIASTVVPLVMSKLVSKTNDPNNSSFNIQDILGNLAGGNGGFDVGSILSGINSANDKNKKGDVVGKLGGLFGK